LLTVPRVLKLLTGGLLDADSEEDLDAFSDRFWEVIPEEGECPFLRSLDHIRHFERASFVDQESYEYMRWFVSSLYFMFGYCFANGHFLDIEDWTNLDKPGKIGTDDINPAVACLLTEFIADPGGMLAESRRAVDELFETDPDRVPSLIPKSEWASLPDPLSLIHVAALIRTTPKNVRNIVSRGKPFPKRIAKPGFRTNYLWKWHKEPFLAFVEVNYPDPYQ
jgi:hypothetical protein